MRTHQLLGLVMMLSASHEAPSAVLMKPIVQPVGRQDPESHSTPEYPIPRVQTIPSPPQFKGSFE